MPMSVFIMYIDRPLGHPGKAALILANHFGSIPIMCFHVASYICCGFSFVAARQTRLQSLLQMNIFNVSSQRRWCGHCHAALATLVGPQMSPDMVPHQLGAVEIFSAFITWKLSIRGGKTFPQEVSSGLKNARSQIIRILMRFLTFALVAKLFPQEGQATAFSPV